MSSVRYALIAAAAAALLAADAAQGGPPKPKPQLMDVPYIQCQAGVPTMVVTAGWRPGRHRKIHVGSSPCLPPVRCGLQVCELLAKNAWRQAKQLMKDATPTNKARCLDVAARSDKT